MATFYYNRYSEESIDSQWLKHLQTQNYIGDIGGIISQNRKELQTTIDNASVEQKKAIQQICGKFDEGLGEVARHLEDINFNITELRGEINAMASLLDWRLSLMIEEQRLTNQLLGNIAQLLRIPDSQKQRVYHIEQGLKYLKNAILEGINSTFYIDALESFKEAEKIERKDFILLNRIGQIYLYSKAHMNIPLSEEYFLKSAREAYAETIVGGTTTSNYLTPIGHQPIIYLENPFKVATAEAYLYASRACYLQNKLSEASNLAGKAYSLIPEFLEAGFEQAKYLAANNREAEAAKVLETIIDKDRYFSIKTLTDQDLSTKKSVLDLLESFQKRAFNRAKSGLKNCKAKISKTSNARNIVSEIEANLSKESFLSSMKAIDLLNAEYQFQYLTNHKGHEMITRFRTNPMLKIDEFIDLENKSQNEFEELKKQVKGEIIKERVLSFTGGGAGLGFVIGFYKGCSLNELTLDFEPIFMPIITLAIVGAIVGYIIGLLIEPNIYMKS